MKNKNAKRIAANRAIMSKYEKEYKELWKRNRLKCASFRWWVENTDQSQYFQNMKSDVYMINILLEAAGKPLMKEYIPL